MEAVYASDEIQIQSEDVFESENEDATWRKCRCYRSYRGFICGKLQSPKRQICRKPKRVEITEDAEQSGDEEIEISEEDSDTEENVADVFSDGAEDTATHVRVVEGGSIDAGNAAYRLYADGTLAINGAGSICKLKVQK